MMAMEKYEFANLDGYFIAYLIGLGVGFLTSSWLFATITAFGIIIVLWGFTD